MCNFSGFPCQLPVGFRFFFADVFNYSMFNPSSGAHEQAAWPRDQGLLSRHKLRRCPHATCRHGTMRCMKRGDGWAGGRLLELAKQRTSQEGRDLGRKG